MDISSVDLAEYSTEKALTDTQDEAGVKILNKLRNQQEAVAATLISSIKETPRAPEQSGHRVNVRA